MHKRQAEAWTLYDGYVKEFGVDIEIKELWKMYLGRKEKYRIRKKASDGTKIPKGMDLNFLRPRTDLERKVQDLIAEWNGRKLGESEDELAKQVARLDAAESKPVSYTHLDVYKRQKFGCPRTIGISCGERALEFVALFGRESMFQSFCQSMSGRNQSSWAIAEILRRS